MALGNFLRSPLLQGLTRDALLHMDPETAHGATISALKLGLSPEQAGSDPPELAISLAGLDLSSGARAGLTAFVAGIARTVADKNVTCAPAPKIYMVLLVLPKL